MVQRRRHQWHLGSSDTSDENASYGYITLALNLLLSFFNEQSLQKAVTPYSQLQRLGLNGASAPVSTSKNLQQDPAYFILWLVWFALFLLA